MAKLTYQNYNGYLEGGTEPAIGFDTEQQKTDTITNASAVPPLSTAVTTLQATSLTQQQHDHLIAIGAAVNISSTGGLIYTNSGATATNPLDLVSKKDIPTVTKESIGLGNVDNTSDANKPISSSTQTALDNKQVRFNTSTGWDTNSFAQSGSGNIFVKGLSKSGGSYTMPLTDITATTIPTELNTTSKYIVGAINEINSKPVNLPNISAFHFYWDNQVPTVLAIIGPIAGVPKLQGWVFKNNIMYHLGNHIDGSITSNRVNQDTANGSNIGLSFSILNTNTSARSLLTATLTGGTILLSKVQLWTSKIVGNILTITGDAFSGSDIVFILDLSSI